MFVTLTIPDSETFVGYYSALPENLSDRCVREGEAHAEQQFWVIRWLIGSLFLPEIGFSDKGFDSISQNLPIDNRKSRLIFTRFFTDFRQV